LSRLHDDALQSDWQQAVHSPQMASQFQAWRAREPALARFADTAALVRFMRGAGSRVDKDAVLCALLTWAKHESTGARVVLEAIRPGLLNLAARITRDPREREELCSTMLLAIWEGIRSYPLARRPRRVAANLLLDTMHRTLVELGRESAWLSIRSLASVESQESSAPEQVDADVDALLAQAVRAGAVSAEEADAILCSRIDDLARSAGVSYNTMKVRRQRAERRLLLFLGYRPVPRAQQNRPSSFARVAGAGPQDLVG
jgi:DNA-directed RNA polymerase specialized sigma24 family protein